MKILHWNVWLNEDIDNILKTLREVNADILCLQEMTIGHSNQGGLDTVQYVAEELGMHSFHRDMEFDDEGYLVNAIFSKEPIKDFRYVWINKPQGEGGFDDEYRCYVEIGIEVAGQDLTIGTTHMSYTHAFEETPRKLGETELLVKEISKSERFIFTGDLNVTPESQTVHRINSILKPAGPDYHQKTWTTKTFDYEGFVANSRDWRLDYVFVTPDIQILSSEIVETQYSDHLPILVEFMMS